MSTNYEERLRIPLEGNDFTNFMTKRDLLIATGYSRIVLGERGPYVEFTPDQIMLANLHIPDDQRYRLRQPDRDRVYYFEWRSNDEANVKVYEQKRTVDYADYRVGFLYASPFDLYIDGMLVIEPLRKKKPNDDQTTLW